MNRSLGRRMVAVWLVATFPLAMGLEPGCPHHDRASSASAHAGARAHHAPGADHRAPPAHAMLAAHATLADHADASSPAATDAPAGHHDGHESPCTCIGDCQGGAAVPQVAAGAAPRDAGPIAVAPSGPHREPLTGPVAYLLPYANAPPTV